MRILITGSRDLTDARLVTTSVFRHFVAPTQIVVGDCPTGADLFARNLDHDAEIHRADWTTHGKAAGPLRNQEMVDSGADLCLAFYKQGAGNRGTKDCVRRARTAGIPVIEHTEVVGE